MGSFVQMKDYIKLVARVTELEARVRALETFHQGEPVVEKAADPIPDIKDAILEFDNAVEEEVSGTTPGSNPLEDLFGTKIALLLIGADLDSLEKVDSASDERLESISGIGGATVLNIREALEEL